MRKGVGFAITVVCVVFIGAASAHAQNAAPDPVARMTLLGAAFAQDGAQPSPHGVTAMAFLPGRGVVRWDVTGKTPEQTKEAQIEAMGLADARAVQREIDAAAQRRADASRQSAPGQTFYAEGAQRVALNMPAIAGAPHVAGGVLPLNRSARAHASALNLRNGEEMGARPRVYAFAAVSGQAVGLNLLHDDAGWKNAGLTTDKDGFAGQRQAGLAWRTGPAQASLSYMDVKTHTHILGMESLKDHRLMLTLNMTPQSVVKFIAKKP
jgi:hypothetical protein